MARKLTDKEYLAIVNEFKAREPAKWALILYGKEKLRKYPNALDNGKTLLPKHIQALKEVGLGRLFSTFADRRREQCLDLRGWIEQHGREPRQRASDKTEKSWANWLCWIRRAKAGKGSWIFYGFEEDLVGIPGLFDRKDFEEERRERCMELKAWIVEHDGKWPTGGSKDATEKSLGRFISSLRQWKAGKGQGVCYGFEEELIGVPGLLDYKDFEEERRERCLDLKAWIVEHDGKWPTRRSKDAREKSLGTFVYSLRQGKAGKGQCVCYGFEEELIGVPGLFDWRDEERRKRCLELKAWIVEHDRLPRQSGKNRTEEERRVGKLITQVKSAKAGEGRGTYYGFEEELVGIPGLFDMKKRKSA